MSKHILFCVHGMGEHDNTWHEKGVRVLKSAFGDFERLSQLDFDATFQFRSSITTFSRKRASGQMRISPRSKGPYWPISILPMPEAGTWWKGKSTNTVS